MWEPATGKDIRSQIIVYEANPWPDTYKDDKDPSLRFDILS